jgi:GntR family transcriptional regulator
MPLVSVVQMPYQALANQLQSTISSVEPGTRVPSEHELAAAHGVHRLTARAALQELERRYLVRRVQGSGTFVTERIEYRVGADSLPSFSKTVSQAGARPRSQTESVRSRRPAAAIRDVLRLDSGDRVWLVSRLRFVDDELVGCADTYVSQRLAPDLSSHLSAAGPGGSLYAAFTDVYGLAPARAGYRVEVEIASETVAGRLRLKGRPWMIATRGRNDDARSGRPLEVTLGFLRADVFRIVMEFEAR